MLKQNNRFHELNCCFFFSILTLAFYLLVFSCVTQSSKLALEVWGYGEELSKGKE